MLGLELRLSAVVLISLVFQLTASNEFESSDEDHIITRFGANVTIPCWPKDFPDKEPSVYWVKKGARHNGETVQNDGSLHFAKLTIEDTSLYVCRREDNDHILRKAHLYVQGPPMAPSNVESQGMHGFAIIKWHQQLNSEWEQEMGGVMTTVNLRYRLATNSTIWQYLPDHIPPSQGAVEVYGLKLNATYEFQVWSENRFGRSSYVSTFATTLSHKTDSNDNEENLSKTSTFILYMAMGFLLTMNISIVSVAVILNGRNHRKMYPEENSEIIELVPNIVENPNYSPQSSMLTLPVETKVLLTHPVTQSNRSTFM